MWARYSSFALLLIVAGCSSSPEPVAGNPPPPPPGPPAAGLDVRPDNSTCIAPARPGMGVDVTVENAFPSLPGFNQPVALLHPPGDSSRWYVVEQAGRVRVFDNNPGVTASALVVDISGRVQDGGEQGLLGMAFHPSFQSNGQVFLSYTRAGPVSYISRFTSMDGGQTLDPNSEEVILTVPQDFSNHNGGNIAFGPDGNLYIGLGDGGSGGDPNNRAQDPTTLLGAMLRIDVDGAAPYAIPGDNPFVGNARCINGSGASNCPEIYAWGFRNPWRWSFDRDTADLWVGDVGQGTWEEVDLVLRGGNYGWRIREGAHCFNPPNGCTTAGLIDPVAEYDHSAGVSITGGYVYRGSTIPGLQGSFIYGDFSSGRIWGLFDNGLGGYEARELIDTGINISSFGQAADGEVYVVNYSGSIHILRPGSGGGGGSAVPTQLSATGCVNPANPAQPASGLIPYAVNTSFWSDGADKSRWLALPNGSTMTIDADDDWSFPNGTVLMKNFSLAGQLVETRLFIRHPDGVWAGYTFEWNDQETDATLVTGGKVRSVNGQDWIYPSEAQCLQCHTSAAGFSLGVETAQLNRDFTYPSTGRTDNQLNTYDAIIMFSSPLPGSPADHPALADAVDVGAPLADRARAYLHVNCSGCHRPGGPAAGVSHDLRYDVDLADTNTCDVVPQAGDLGITGARILSPGDPASSILVERMRRRDANAMPPLGSNLVDDAGVMLIENWISGLAACP